MARQEMPIFVRTFDMLAWLLPATNHFPRPYRHSFTQRLLDAAFDLSEALHEANLRYGKARLERLAQADEALDMFGDYKDQLWAWKTAVVDRLARYRLAIHPHAQPRPVSKGVSFLGFRIFPERRRLKRRKGIHFRRRFQQKLTGYADGAITLDQLTASVQGWLNHTRHGNTVGLRKAILSTQIVLPPRYSRTPARVFDGRQ